MYYAIELILQFLVNFFLSYGTRLLYFRGTFSGHCFHSRRGKRKAPKKRKNEILHLQDIRKADTYIPMKTEIGRYVRMRSKLDENH